MKRFSCLTSFVAGLVILSATADLVRGIVVITGDVDPVGEVTSLDSWTVEGHLHVGKSGSGTLDIMDGGMVSNNQGNIGYNTGSTGEAMVTGTDSQWNNSHNLFVGRQGSGTLSVEAGAVVADNSGIIGWTSGATGEAMVTGSGSQWNNSNRLMVGRQGSGMLAVMDGGVASNTKEGYLGHYSGSTGEATVTGAGSQWNNSDKLYVGDNGIGTLNVVAEGVVTNTDHGYIGKKSGSTGVATVTGTGSQWNNSNSLYVGGSSSGAGGSGTLNIDDSGLVTVSDTTKLWSTGTVNLDGGILETGTLDLTEGTFNMLDGILRTDSVTGALSNQGGTLALGNSPEILTVTGGYTQGAAATLEIELGGTVRGDEYDAMIVDGDFTLDGSLNVLPIGGFAPQADDLFDILDFEPANLSGVFNSVNLPALSSGLDWDQTNLYTTGELLVSLSQIAGDFDVDGDVDGDDFLLWQENFPILDGTAGSLSGDANGDGDVDGDDFLVWQRNFPYPEALSSVPEPNSLALLALGATGVLVYRRRLIQLSW